MTAPPTALVLCGGLGTRLRTATGSTPKALAGVAGRPFLDHLLERLRGLGLVDVVLCTGWGSGTVHEYCGNGSRWGLEVRLSPEAEPLGTGGAVRRAAPLARMDPFLVLNGDSVCRFDLGALRDFHAARGALATILLAPVEDRSRFGSVEIDAGGAVTGFLEKGGGGPGLVNAGVYLLALGALQWFPEQPPLSLEREVLPVLVGRGLYGFAGGAGLYDIGTPEALAGAQSLAEFESRELRGEPCPSR